MGLASLDLCKAGGAPVVVEPSTIIEPLIQDTEGVFCPKACFSSTVSASTLSERAKFKYF